MTDDQVERLIDIAERGVVAFESIGFALSGINVAAQRLARKYAPDPRRQEDAREAVVSRVPNDEDRAKEAQGASSTPIREWINLEEDIEEEIGPREKELLLEKRRSEINEKSGSSSRGPEEIGSDRG